MEEKELVNNSSSPNEMTVDTSTFSRSGTNISSVTLNNSYGGISGIPKKQKTTPNASAKDQQMMQLGNDFEGMDINKGGSRP